MRAFCVTATLALCASLATAALSKPPLQDDLGNMQDGLRAHLQPVHSTRGGWKSGHLPSDCKRIVENEKFSPADIQTWNIRYDDCSTPWIICYHKKSGGTLNDLVERLGRVPVHTRQWIRHVITLPSANGHAYNDNGNVAIFGTSILNLEVYIHEAAHSLDLLHAYKDKPLSSSANWINAYNKDSAVPDRYAQTNQVENVAQNTVVATFDVNVPGGFPSVQKNWKKIANQLALIKKEEKEAGNLLLKGGKCTRRLKNSPAVPNNGARMAEAAADVPDVSLPADMEVIPDVEFNTKDICASNSE